MNIASALIFIVAIIGVVYSLQNLFMTPIYEDLLGVTVSQIRAFSGNVMDQIIHLFQFTGLYMLGTTSMSAVIALIPYRRGEKWSWYVQLIIGGITLIGQLILVYIAGNLLPAYYLPFNVILILMWLAGIIIPIKEFFNKN